MMENKNDPEYFLAQTPPEEEIVITGMAGSFPESDNVYQYLNNIYNKTDMITGDNRRWLPTNPEIPHRSGKLNWIQYCDAGYFDLHYYHATQMDPMVRMILEKTYEAILDAGYSVNEMVNQKVGVFVGCCFSESEEACVLSTQMKPNFGITGCNRSMVAQHISYAFKFDGPSYIVDTACSSSMYAFEHAYRAIKEGKCDSAIVGGVSLCLNPLTSLQFARLGVLSMDGRCKAFDETANGYARSETVAVLFLQKTNIARRIYAQVIHTKTNSDGFKEQGITFPSSQMQKELLDDTYKECELNPALIDVLEAHATGTKVGDPEEMAAMDLVFCKNRTRPLYVGSIKSYLGHTEGASGICSLIKVLLGIENNCILPNINFKTPRQSIKAIIEGRMIVPVDTIPWPKDSTGYVAINSFGFGGSNAHVILKKVEKPKINGGVPDDNLPRLLCVSGRTKKCLKNIFNDISSRKLDSEYCRLIQQIFKDTDIEHMHRGYIIHSKWGEIERKNDLHKGKNPSLCVLFPGANQEFVEIGKQLYKFPSFSQAIKRIDSVLTEPLSELVENGFVKNASQLILVSLTVQLALIDTLKEIKFPLTFSLGQSIGELAAAYADGKITLPQAVLAGHHIATLVSDSKIKNLYSLELTLEAKATVLLKRLQNLLPESEKYLERLLNPLPLDKITWPHPKNTKLCVILLGSQDIELNGFSCMKITGLDAVNSFLRVLGSTFMMGYTIHTELLYPPLKWPVSVGTPMISPLISWNHDIEWFTALHAAKDPPPGVRQLTLLNKEIDWSFLPGHMIDGLVLMPATGYIFMVWETYCKMNKCHESSSCIIFENVKFHSATQITKNATIEFKILFGRQTYKFEIADVGNPIASGYIYSFTNSQDEFSPIPALLPPEEELKYSSKDIYKEFRLRGYNYSGAFRAIDKGDLTGEVCWIKWEQNWITFIDNMLQVKLLSQDTRNLYVPTCIQRLVINGPKHVTYVKSLGETPLLPVYSYPDTNIITSGGIEMRGLFATAISRRKARGEPVLETHKFIPFETELCNKSAMRVFTQIFLENSFILKVKVVEVLEEKNREQSLAPLIQDALNDQPVIKSDILIFATDSVEVPNMKVVNKSLSNESECSIIIVEEASTKPFLLNDARIALKDNGIIISREHLNFNQQTFSNCDIISVLKTETETLVLLKKSTNLSSEKIIEVSLDGSKFDWMAEVQNSIKNDKKVLLVVQNEPLSGVLGFINCLRREPGGMLIRCVFIMDLNTTFNPSHPFFSQQLQKGIAINVVKNGQWGTYRHLLLQKKIEVEKPHIFNNLEVVGNLSSLTWVEGPLTNESVVEPEKLMVKVHCSSLNFKDIMMATGRITADAFTQERLYNSTAQGFEYSGKDLNGNRVMGTATSGALSTLLEADSVWNWKIPDEWSMEEAATIPITYSTVLYGLVLLGRIKPRESILIHAGSGGIGQAAINIALFYRCKIFTTVGTEEKRQFINNTFPQIPDTHIGNSRDCSFEHMVMKYTKGKGVDLVINSLAEEKLKASLRCLAPNGRFLEIGKYDLVSNNNLPLPSVIDGRVYVGTMLDLFFCYNPCMKKAVKDVVQYYLDKKAIKPLSYMTYKKNEVEQAYRYMAAGKHIGKIIIRIREEHKESPALYRGFPRFFCNPNMTYIVIGGLGGFGLELIDWLVIRGARKLVLVSRTGVKTGYAASRIRIWKTYAVIVHVVTDDVTTQDGCLKLLTNAEKIGPVVGIFNLAVVLIDALFENQIESNFLASLSPKARATYYLDIVSRQLCPKLEHFVVFSSVSCGRGNIGQTNYGMANSIMERICEKRKSDGYPGLAIQWGAIGEVGLVAEMQEQQREIEIGGTLQQRVASCLNCLDIFLKQNEPVVASMVVAEKRSTAEGAANVIDLIKNIMGITDLKTVSEHATLPELGMDSMTAVEIKQTLERDCDVFLNPKEIRTLTFARLKEILSDRLSEKESGVVVLQRINVLHRFIGNEEDASIPIKKLPSLVGDEENAPTVYLLPGIEGMSNIFESLATNLKAHAVCLQYVIEQTDGSISALAKSLRSFMVLDQEPFSIVAYSYGCIIALELVSLLESEGRTGTLILIDGSLEMFKELVKQQIPDADSAPIMETVVLSNLMNLHMPTETVDKYKETIYKLNSLEERINFAISVMPEEMPHSKEYQRQVCAVSCLRMMSLFSYNINFPKFKSSVTLFKPSQATLQNYDEDYRLQKLCEKPLSIQVIEGNHLNIVKNKDLAIAINKIINDEDM